MAATRWATNAVVTSVPVPLLPLYQCRCYLCTSAVVTSVRRCCDLQEYSDAMLSLMMSTITKGLYSVNDMVDKYNVAYDKLGRRRTPM